MTTVYLCFAWRSLWLCWQRLQQDFASFENKATIKQEAHTLLWSFRVSWQMLQIDPCRARLCKPLRSVPYDLQLPLWRQTLKAWRLHSDFRYASRIKDPRRRQGCLQREWGRRLLIRPTRSCHHKQVKQQVQHRASHWALPSWRILLLGLGLHVAWWPEDLHTSARLSLLDRERA